MAKDRTEDESVARNAAQFATTHWSVVLAAGDSASPDSQEALERLCRSYWFPLYAFVRRKGYAPEDAQDLTQEFFRVVLEKHRLRHANAARGKFRSFLLASLNHFLANEWHRLTTAKRGGGINLVSWDEVAAEERYRVEIAESRSPDEVFDRQWALVVLDRVLGRLQEEMAEAGHADLFARAKPWLLGEPEPGEYAREAPALGMTPAALKMAVSRLRRRYGDLLRQEIAQTVTTAQQAEEELRDLIHAMSRPPA